LVERLGKIEKMDQKILYLLNGLTKRNQFWDSIFKFLALYFIYTIPIFLLIYWFLGSKKVALRAVLSGLLAWQVFAPLVGFFYYRPRPFVVLPARELFFHRPTYSFPSDHASFLFALGFSFFFSGKRQVAFWLLSIGVLISLARVVAGVHYPTDILAGWGLGFLTAWLIWKVKDPVDRYFSQPLIRIAKKIRLA